MLIFAVQPSSGGFRREKNWRSRAGQLITCTLGKRAQSSAVAVGIAQLEPSASVMKDSKVPFLHFSPVHLLQSSLAQN